MRKRLLGAVSACAITLAFAGIATPASAQQDPYSSDIDAVCNPATGQYDVTVTLSQGIGLLVADATYTYYVGSSAFGPTDTAFDPSTVVSPGTSTATESVPGNAIGVEFEWYIPELDNLDGIGTELSGDCVAVATTTTSTTTGTDPVVTTTTTAGVGAVTATPSFTG